MYINQIYLCIHKINYHGYITEMFQCIYGDDYYNGSRDYSDNFKLVAKNGRLIVGFLWTV